MIDNVQSLLTKAKPGPDVADSAKNSPPGDNIQSFSLLVKQIVGQKGEVKLPAIVPEDEMAIPGEEMTGNNLPFTGQETAMNAWLQPVIFYSDTNQALNHSMSMSQSDSDVLPQAILPELAQQASVIPLAATNTNIGETGRDADLVPGLQTTHLATQKITLTPAEIPQAISKGQVDNATVNNSLLVDSDNNLLVNTNPATTSAHSGQVSARSELPLSQPVVASSPGFSQEVGERVRWMVNQNIQKAEIRLDPPDLGSIEIRVVVQKDHTQVTFAAPHAQARDALESGMPRLKEMMNEQGINLINVDVGSQTFSQQQEAQSAHRELSHGQSAITDNSTEDTVTDGVYVSANGLLDTYA